jgi:hypothetical protein
MADEDDEPPRPQLRPEGFVRGRRGGGERQRAERERAQDALDPG